MRKLVFSKPLKSLSASKKHLNELIVKAVKRTKKLEYFHYYVMDIVFLTHRKSTWTHPIKLLLTRTFIHQQLEPLLH